jgi:ribose-phosphate pyrophosphokinase
MTDEETGLDFMILAGNSNLVLSKKISEHLDTELCKAKIKRFSDGEIQIEIQENVRKRKVMVVQSLCRSDANNVNDNIVELLLMIDALKRSSVKRVTVVMPYFGYARQDKKVAPRVPISAKLLADLIEKAGANRIIGMDFHSAQIQGFFNVPVDNMSAWPALFNYVLDNYERKSLVVVSPDAGGTERARAFAKPLGANVAIVDKRRSAPNQAKAMSIIGDVEGKVAIILDDMIDTAGTITEAADLIIEKGAIEVHGMCTHPVLSGKAIERIKESSISSVVVADTIPLNDEAKTCDKIVTISISKIIAESVRRSFLGESVSDLFLPVKGEIFEKIEY